MENCDPLTNMVVHTGDESEDVLFSRPQKLMPTNPFVNLETRFDLAITETMTNAGSPPQRLGPFSDNDESEIEFDQRLEREKRLSVTEQTRKGQRSKGSLPNSQRSSFGFTTDEDRLDVGKLAKSLQEPESGTEWSLDWPRRKSSDCMNVSAQNSTGVRTEDVVFTSAIFFSHVLSFAADLTLMCWYYWDEADSYNFKWCSALTFMLMVAGSFGILSQFNQAEKERLDRLFRHGRLVQIAVNCFPPLGSILCSYYSFRSATKARQKQVYSVQFFAIEEFTQGLSRIQGFLQSAPQATLQLVILLETWNMLSVGKGLLTSSCVILSLTVMTIANLPGRSDMVEQSVRKGIYSPVSRIFLGVRMFSSFASRSMALALFFAALRCLLGSRGSVILGIGAITVPRLGFTMVDYFYHFTRVRRGREAGRLSLCGTFSGYMATIFFPMSHPLWVFWFIWIETVTLISIGFVVALTAPSASCVSVLVNFMYAGIFVVLFIVIPLGLPLARATVQKNQRSQKIAKMFSERDREPYVANLQDTPQTTISI